MENCAESKLRLLYLKLISKSMFISKYNSLTKDLYKIVLEFSFVFSDAKSTREYKYANKAFLSNATFFKLADRMRSMRTNEILGTEITPRASKLF